MPNGKRLRYRKESYKETEKQKLRRFAKAISLATITTSSCSIALQRVTEGLAGLREELKHMAAGRRNV